MTQGFCLCRAAQVTQGCQSLTDQLIDQSIYIAAAMTEGGRKLCEPEQNFICLGPKAALGQSCAGIRSISHFSLASL